MHVGLSMESDYWPDVTQQQAFDEALFLSGTGIAV